MLEALFLHVREALGDEALGLHIFEKIEAARFGDLGILAMVAPTYGEALRAGFQIYRLVSNSFTTQVEVDEPEARVKIISHVPDGIATRGLVEAKMVLTVVRAPVQTGIGPLPLRKIHFEFPRPAYGEEFEPIFNCPVEFDRDENCAYFDAGILSKKMPGGNPEIQDRIYGKITSRLEGGQRNNLVLRVRDCFRENPAQVKLTAVARQLGLGERTLQLHLARIGESFRAIKEGICMEGAMRLLMEPELSIEDVAYRLGYEDTTSLYKAFRRWTGGTPRNMP